MKGHFNDSILITGGFHKGRNGVIYDYDLLMGYYVRISNGTIFPDIAFVRFWQFKVYYDSAKEESFKRGYEQGFKDGVESIPVPIKIKKK